MYNCLFGMPNRRNFSYHNTFNRNPLPNPSKNHNGRQHIEKKHESNPIAPVTNRNLLKSSVLGGMFISGDTNQGTTYNVITINLDTSTYRNFTILFNFSCNITCNMNTQSPIQLRFQLLKQDPYTKALTPVSSSFSYARVSVNLSIMETDTFSLTTCNHDSIKCKYCNYSVFVEIITIHTTDSILITNPILIASIIENSNDIKKGENNDIKNPK